MPMAELIRDALDTALGTDHSEIGRPGRKPNTKETQP